MKTRTTAAASSIHAGETISAPAQGFLPSIHDVEFSNANITARLKELYARRETYRAWAEAKANGLLDVVNATLADLDTMHEAMEGGTRSAAEIQDSFNEQADKIHASYVSSKDRHIGIANAQLATIQASVEFYLSYLPDDDQPLH